MSFAWVFKNCHGQKQLKNKFMWYLVFSSSCLGGESCISLLLSFFKIYFQSGYMLLKWHASIFHAFLGPENPSLQTREEPRVLKVRHALVHQWQALRKLGEGTHGHKKESPLLHGASGNFWYTESGLKCLLMAFNAKPHKSLSAASLRSWALCVGCNLHGWATLSLPISLQCREPNRIHSQRFSEIWLLFSILFTVSVSLPSFP